MHPLRFVRTNQKTGIVVWEHFVHPIWQVLAFVDQQFDSHAWFEALLLKCPVDCIRRWGIIHAEVHLACVVEPVVKGSDAIKRDIALDVDGLFRVVDHEIPDEDNEHVLESEEPDLLALVVEPNKTVYGDGCLPAASATSNKRGVEVVIVDHGPHLLAAESLYSWEVEFSEDLIVVWLRHGFSTLQVLMIEVCLHIHPNGLS
jgi:hypothetical protein